MPEARQRPGLLDTAQEKALALRNEAKHREALF